MGRLDLHVLERKDCVGHGVGVGLSKLLVLLSRVQEFEEEGSLELLEHPVEGNRESEEV